MKTKVKVIYGVGAVLLFVLVMAGLWQGATLYDQRHMDRIEEVENLKFENAVQAQLIISQEKTIDKLETKLVNAQNELAGNEFMIEAMLNGQWEASEDE